VLQSIEDARTPPAVKVMIPGDEFRGAVLLHTIRINRFIESAIGRARSNSVPIVTAWLFSKRNSHDSSTHSAASEFGFPSVPRHDFAGDWVLLGAILATVMRF